MKIKIHDTDEAVKKMEVMGVPIEIAAALRGQIWDCAHITETGEARLESQAFAYGYWIPSEVFSIVEN